MAVDGLAAILAFFGVVPGFAHKPPSCPQRVTAKTCLPIKSHDTAGAFRSPITSSVASLLIRFHSVALRYVYTPAPT